MYCDMKIVLTAQSGVVNRNGVVYTEECLQNAFAPEKLRNIPITFNGEIIGKTSENGYIKTVIQENGQVEATIPVKFFCGATGTCERVLMDEKTVVSATVTEISLGLENATN